MTPGHRRDFLTSIGAATLAGGVLGETARGFQANDTIRVACLGTGGRCRALMKSLAAVPNVAIVGIADVNADNLAAAKSLADARAVASGDFRSLLDRNDIDAVLVASPDHWHVPMTVAACKAGKDVYVEKPLTHSLSEAAEVIQAQNEHKRVVQVGMQQRSMPQFQKAREMIAAGRIGRVFKAHLTWNRNAAGRLDYPYKIDPSRVDWKGFLGNAPDRAFDPYILGNWRWFWDFGGGLLTDLMVHFVDVVHWILDLDHPEKAVTIGNHFGSGDRWQTPDTIQTLLQYPRDIQVYFEGTFSNARNAAMVEFMGTEGTLYLDRGRYELYPERGKGPVESMILGSNPLRGQDFYDKPDGELLHLTNWINAVRSRSRPIAPAEAGASSASAAHLGNRAFREGGVAVWVKNSS